MRLRASAAAFSALLLAALAASSACGTDAVGVEACRQIETIRCRRAPGCGIDLSRPVHRGTPERDVTECVRFYEDACLHGLANPVDPGAVQVKACVDTLAEADCEIVKNPGVHPSCAFLVPPAPPPEPAPAPDAAVEAATEGGT